MIILPLRGAIKYEKYHHIFSKKRFWAAKSRFSMHKRSQSERNLLSSDRRCLHKRLEMPVHVTVFAASPHKFKKMMIFKNFDFWKILKITILPIKNKGEMIHTIVFFSKKRFWFSGFTRSLQNIIFLAFYIQKSLREAVKSWFSIFFKNQKI